MSKNNLKNNSKEYEKYIIENLFLVTFPRTLLKKYFNP